MLSIKSIISQKLNIVKFSKLKLNRFSKLCIFWDKKKIHITLRIFNDHISKTESFKNREIDFSFVSEHCATIWTEKIRSFRWGRSAYRELGNAKLLFCVDLKEQLFFGGFSENFSIDMDQKKIKKNFFKPSKVDQTLKFDDFLNLIQLPTSNENPNFLYPF